MNTYTSNIMEIKMDRRHEYMIRSMFLGAFLIIGVGVSPVRAAEETPHIVVKENIPTIVLPNPLKRFIGKQYPSLHLPTKADLTGPWAAFNKKGSVPYACWGHFDDRGETDVALILLGQKGWRVLAFHPLGNDQYAVLPLEGYAGSTEDFTKAHAPQEFYLYTVKAGESVVIYGKKIPETEHKHDAVAFFSLKDPETGILYQWMPPGKNPKEEYRYGDYIPSVFGALSD